MTTEIAIASNLVQLVWGLSSASLELPAGQCCSSTPEGPGQAREVGLCKPQEVQQG